MVERFHWTLKAVFTAQESPRWSERLLIVLLALRNTVKQGINASTPELVYGTTLRLPGEFFHAAAPEPTFHDLITALRGSMAQLRPVGGTSNDSTRHIFMSARLDTVSHVFLRIYAHRPPLQPLYEGPYAVFELQDKLFMLQLINRCNETHPVTIGSVTLS